MMGGFNLGRVFPHHRKTVLTIIIEVGCSYNNYGPM